MIIRVAHRPRYTAVANETVEDARLTWEARGLLFFLLSKPDHWQVNREHLAKQAPNGETVVRRVLRELQTLGYLERVRVNGPDGKLQWEAVVYEHPPTIGGKPTSGEPTCGEPTGGQQPLLVTTEVATTDRATSRADAFDAFWQRYPRKVAKPAALRAWRKVDDVDAVMRGLEAWCRYWQARNEPEFVPHPATWLNGERWNDAPPPTPVRPGARAPIDNDRQAASGRVTDL